MNINHNLTQSDIINIDVESHLKQLIQIQDTKESAWIFDEINSKKTRFYKTGELNGSNYVKFFSRSKAILEIRKDDKYCSIWSIVASFHPCFNDNPNRVSNYRHFLNELNIEGFDFTNGFKCGNVHNFEKLNNLSINISELNFYQDRNKWKHKLIPIEISKNESEKVIDLVIYKTPYAFIKKLNVYLGDHQKKFNCRRCLNWYTSENMLTLP